MENVRDGPPIHYGGTALPLLAVTAAPEGAIDASLLGRSNHERRLPVHFLLRGQNLLLKPVQGRAFVCISL